MKKWKSTLAIAAILAAGIAGCESNQTHQNSSDSNMSNNNPAGTGSVATGQVGSNRPDDPLVATGNASANSGNMSGNLSILDRQFVDTAASAGMEEVQAGQLADSQSNNDTVRHFAQHMVTDHTQANNKLMAICKQNNWSCPANLNTTDQASIDKIKNLKGDNFDRQYVSDQLKAHQDAVALFQKESDSGQDADLKQFAASTLPTLKAHLSMVQDLTNKFASER